MTRPDRAAELISQGYSPEHAQRAAAREIAAPEPVTLPAADSAVRAWCVSHDVPCSPRGKVSAASRAAYDAGQ
jgi:hypothetical protein